MRRLPKPPRSILDGASLFLDFDGTLTDFVAPGSTPELDEATIELLLRLSKRLDGRIAIISGRSLASLASMLEVGGLDLTGSHGAERRHSSGAETISGVGDASELHRDSRSIAEELGVFLEEKPVGAAFHFRGKPELEEQVATAVKRLALRHRVEFRRGAMVYEVRAPGPHKGDAVLSLMKEEPFEQGMPLFVGDDMTDEDGFAAARELGGHGILVGPPRETAADFGLPTVKATIEWLSQ